MFRGYTQAGGDFAPLIDPFAGVRAAGAGALGADGDGEGKKRRVMAKVDADRLMEANGLPALMQKAKRFKVRGKGREVSGMAIATASVGYRDGDRASS
jgi:replication fork protection complex subunit Csm3/Swi3